MASLAEIIGDSAGIRRLRDQLEQILKRAAAAPRPPSLLLRGETGTGKGLVARTIHRAGPRANAPFVDVNCAAIPENLLEAELFGYERGAFTGANQAKPGLFQVAHRGMLFLDEIGTLAPALQAKLLKVLEEGVVRRLGATRAEPVDVWIVSATNEDLAEAMRARRFREDLYHRVALLSVELPPLRERGEDILVLAERFLARACADYGLSTKTFARDARAALAAYAWPGNVRELGNIIERVALLADESIVTAAMLALPRTVAVDHGPETEPAPSGSAREQMRAHLLETLAETGWNISQTAVRLGVARNTVLARIERFGLKRSADTETHEAPAPAPTEVAVSRTSTSPAAWEPRRVALLRVDVDRSGPFDALIAKVETFGGEVVDLGRGVFVAAFGLEAVEDAPVRAALAALAILNASARAKSGDGAGPRAKLVVHVAQVLVSQLQGAVTIDLESKRAAWTTIEALAGLDEFDAILVSETASRFLERRFEITSTSTNDAIPVRRLTRRERTGFGLGGRQLSRFVGRGAEIRLVADPLAAAARGRGQVIGIVGESGVGKSRFTYELTRLDATRGWRVLNAGAVSHGAATPFLPVSDFLRRYFSIEDVDEPERVRRKVTEALASRHEALNAAFAPVLSLLDIAVDDSSWRNLDPPQRRQRMHDAVKHLLLNESRIQPLLLIIEDLHWIDAETQAVLDGLVDGLPGARLVLAVTYRSGYEHQWGSKTYYSQLRLDALPPENAGEFLDAVLGADPALEPVKRLLVRRGNPFFIEESIQTLVESGALVGERGAYRPARVIQDIEVPATVQTILAARIERLTADDKRLLQTASVIGRDVPAVLLHAVTGVDEAGIEDGLARLRAAEFLYEMRSFPDAEYTFKHALTHEVAYGTLLDDRRRDLHARIVGAIERLYPDRLTQHVERLAHHAVRGELWERAVTYLDQSGTKAVTRAAYRDAVTYLEQALTALEHLPESAATLERAVDLRLDLKGALFPLGSFARIFEHLHAAERYALSLNDQRRLCRLYTDLCHTVGLAGHPREAIVFGEKSRAIAESLGDIPLQVTANTYLGGAYLRTGDYRRAEVLLGQVLHVLEGSDETIGTGFPAPTVRGYLAMIFTDRGKFEQAIVHGREGERLSEVRNHPVALANIWWLLAYVHLERREIQEAVTLFERGLALTRELNLSNFEVFHAAGLGYAYALSGRTAEGIALLERAMSAYATMGHRFSHAIAATYLGEAYGLADRLDDALELAGRALSTAREWGLRCWEARALHLLGGVAARRDSPEEAERHYRDALALAEELEMRPLAARCHAGLGRLFERAGTRNEAQEHLTIATTMYREMGMSQG